MKEIYFNNSGVEVSRKADGWQRSYPIKGFENDKVEIKLELSGYYLLEPGEPKSNVKLYRVDVSAITTSDIEGNPLKSPLKTTDPYLSKTFQSKQEASSYYEDMILKYTDGFIDEEGDLVETGNKIAPVKKPKSDVPSVSLSESEVLGTW